MVDGASTEDKPLKIPKEVWILVNHLFTKSCDQVRIKPVVKLTFGSYKQVFYYLYVYLFIFFKWVMHKNTNY